MELKRLTKKTGTLDNLIVEKIKFKLNTKNSTMTYIFVILRVFSIKKTHLKMLKLFCDFFYTILCFFKPLIYF